jgi:type IV pilus assembly protein PilX
MNTCPPFSSVRSSSPPTRQHGVVLLVSLLFLIVLTLLGVAASRMVTSEERQSRYLREYNTAFQSAEAAMRDARDDIDDKFADGQRRVTPRIGPSTAYFPDCAFGLCQYDRFETSPPWRDPTKWANAIEYGTYSLRSPLPQSGTLGTAAANGKNEDESAATRFSTAAALSNIGGVWKQPSYLIEALPDNRPGTNSLEVGRKNILVTYRLTARGYGADPNSHAMVQEIYAPTNPLLDAK